MAALAHGTPCGARGSHCAPRRLSAKRAAAARANVPRAPARWVAVKATEDGPSPPAAGSSRRLFSSVGLFAPLGAAYDAVGRWLVAHPAPQWVVNSPAKTKFTSFLASVLDPEFDLDASKAAVEKLIASDDVVVFSATYCPFSAAAKRALTAEGVPFTAVEWNETKGGAGFAPALAEITGRSSIPHVFVCGKSVGGCNDGNPGIRPLIASGGLDEALAGCSQKTRDARAAFLEARGDTRAA
jgi:glutaredoxin 3